jgi:hypothetical protein
MQDAPIRRLEAAKDRIVAAIDARTELDAAAKASWSGDAKELYDTMLAANDRLRAPRLDDDGARIVRSLLGLAASGAAQVASELRTLGADGRTLERELTTAVRACHDHVTARLTGCADERATGPVERVVALAPDEYQLPCARCGVPAVTIGRAHNPDEALRLVLGGSDFVYAGVTRRMALDPAAMDRIFAWLDGGDLAALHRYLADEAQIEGGLDAYCPECDLIYCRLHYQVREEWDEGFFDCSRGHCPHGHSRIIDD